MINYLGPHTPTKELVMDRLVYNIPPEVGVDTETISLTERFPIGFSIATSPEESFYFRTHPEWDEEIELYARPILMNPNITKVFHNAMFDLKVLPLIVDVDMTNIADTSVAARLLGEEFASLEALAPMVNKEAWSVKDILPKGQTMLDIPWEQVWYKCCADTKATLALWYKFKDEIKDIGLADDYWEIEMKVIPILVALGLRGVAVDQEERAKWEREYRYELDFFTEMAKDMVGEDFNPGSTQQVGYALAERGNFLRPTKGRKQLNTSKDELQFIDDPLAAIILQYRHYRNALSKYLYPWADEDRIYTSYNLDARVGRVSSSAYNMQNVPSEKTGSGMNIRPIIVPDNGVFTHGDFSQEHLRILCHFSGDRMMRRVYEEGEMGGDIHEFTAAQLNIQRKFAKNINHAIPYGGTARTVKYQSGIADLRRCAEFLNKWKAIFRDAADWLEQAQRIGMREGWSLPTLFGRRIRIPEEYDEGMRNKAVNYPILGSDGEVMKRALVLCAEEGLPLAITVHDSIDLDGDVEFPVERLENIAPVHIPFEVKQTRRWE